MIRTIVLSIVSVLLVTSFTHAAMPLKALNQMQTAASEHVEFTATEVKTKPQGKDSIRILVTARITKVHRSKSGLKVGKTITMDYWNPKPGVEFDGDWPDALKKDGRYWGYLNHAGKDKYSPAANSMSFGAVEKAKDTKKVVFTFKRFGGFAGFHDDLTVYSDFSFVSKAPKHRPNMNREGKLSSSQQAMLKQILSTYGKVSWERTSGPKVRDGMDESISLNGTGKKNKLNPKDLEFGTLSRIANTIITTARQKKSKPVIKQIGGLPTKEKKR